MKKLGLILLLIGLAFQLCVADEPMPSPCEAFTDATAANDVYKNHPPHPIGCPGHEMQSNYQTDDGFYAEVYGDEKNGFIIAFRGTKETQDWIDDLLQGLNGGAELNEQFREAADYISEIKDVLNACFPNASKTIVGHSLGGALAQYAATLVGAGYKTVTFNPAALLPDGAKLNNAKSVFNYVHGDDLLYQMVNPLLKQLKSKGCPGIASGYIGNTILLTDETHNYDFSKLDISCDDITKTVEIFTKLNDELPGWAEGGWGQKVWLAKELPSIMAAAGKIEAFPKILEAVSPGISQSWSDLCNEYNAKLPPDVQWWDILGADEWNIEHTFKLVAKSEDFFGKLATTLGHVKNSANAHLLGEVEDEPGHYEKGSVLGVLQKQCRDSGGEPVIIGGYSRVPGGCYGNLPMDDNRPADYLDQMGWEIEQVGGTIQEIDGLSGKAVDILQLIGKVNPELGDAVGSVLDIISIDAKYKEINARCNIALKSGNEQDFVNAVNDGLKYAIEKFPELLGKVIGGIRFGPVGGIAGGWLGGAIGEIDYMAYDYLLKDIVTAHVIEPLFDLLCPNKGKGGGGDVVPPSTPPGGGGGNNGGSGSGGAGQNGGSGNNDSGNNGSGQNGGSGNSGSGGSNSGGGSSSQQTGPGYRRDDNFKTISR